MIPWWGWLLISLGSLFVLYYFIVVVLVGIIFGKVFKDF